MSQIQSQVWLVSGHLFVPLSQAWLVGHLSLLLSPNWFETNLVICSECVLIFVWWSEANVSQWLFSDDISGLELMFVTENLNFKYLLLIKGLALICSWCWYWFAGLVDPTLPLPPYNYRRFEQMVVLVSLTVLCEQLHSRCFSMHLNWKGHTQIYTKFVIRPLLLDRAGEQESTMIIISQLKWEPL